MLRHPQDPPPEVIAFLEEIEQHLPYGLQNLPGKLGFENHRQWMATLCGEKPWPKPAILKLAHLLQEDPTELFVRHSFFWKGITIDEAQKIAHETGNDLYLTTEPHAA